MSKKIPYLLATGTICLAQIGQADEPSQRELYQNLGWLNAEQIASMPVNLETFTFNNMCKGAYIKPPKEQANSNDQNVAFGADKLSTQLDGKSKFESNVSIKQGHREIYADEVIYDKTLGIGNIYGNFVLREPNILISGESADVFFNQDKFVSRNSDYLIYANQSRGSASEIKNDSKQIVKLEHASYTSCPPMDNTWNLKASEIELNQGTGWGTAKHMRLTIEDFPVFYFPWWRFPITDERQTGVLYPTIGSSSDNGIEFSLPIYLNLAPNYDATLTPNYFEDRGTLYDISARFLDEREVSYSKSKLITEAEAGYGILTDDDQFGDDRKVSFWDQTTTMDNFKLDVDYTWISDDDFFDDLDTSLNASSKTHLDQKINVSYTHDHSYYFATFQKFQTIDQAILDKDLPFNKKPQLLALNNFPIGDSGFNFNINSEYVYFEHPKDDTLNPQDAHRYYVSPELSYDFNRSWGFVKPAYRHYYRNYDITAGGVNVTDTSPEDTEIYTFSIDSGLIFERPTEFKSSRFTQTLEPRLYYVYTPYEEQDYIPEFDSTLPSINFDNMFRHNRFTGRDRIGDADQITFGLTSRFTEDETGVEHLNISVAQIFYFEDRRVQLNPFTPDETDNKSPLAGQFFWQINEAVDIKTKILWDYESNTINSGGGFLKYRQEDLTLNLGYQYYNEGADTSEPNAEDINQSDFSFMYRLNPKWRFFGRWFFDIDLARSQDNLVGIEYTNCCWRVRAVNRRYLQDDDVLNSVEPKSSFMIEFELKGLGGIGDKVASTLEEAIFGFNEENERFR